MIQSPKKKRVCWFVAKEEAELERAAETEALTDAGLVGQSKTSTDETIEMIKKAVVTKVTHHPPPRGIFAIRHFPPCCGREVARINTEAASESAALETNIFSHKMPSLEIMEVKMKEEATESGHRENASTTGDQNMFQLDTKQQCKNDMDKCVDGRFSGQHHHRMNLFPARTTEGLEHPAPRVIVHALMAPSKFLSPNRTTAFTAKLMTDLAKGKL